MERLPKARNKMDVPKKEEKKLTDEEIAKAILQSIEYSKTITYFDEWGNCKSIFVADVLDLIRRLQSKKKLAERASESYKTIMDGQNKMIDEQKAEIERLTEELKYYRGELQ